MGRRIGRLALLALTAGLVTTCGSEKPFVGSADQVSAVDRRAAIPLTEAIERGLVKVIARDHNSTRTEMGLVLKPTGTSQPWIRIDAGWQAASPEKPDQIYITTQTKYARLAQRSNLLVTIPHVQRTLFRSFGVPTGSILSQCEDQPLLDYFTAIENSDTTPEWKDLQIATWVLTENIAFDKVRMPPNDGKIRLNTHPTVSSVEVQRIVGLLEQLGHDRSEMALWTGALDEVDRLVDRYEALVDSEARRAIVVFKLVCDLYPLESASDVLIGSFDRHRGQEGLLYRRYAFDVLRRVGGSEEIELIKRHADMESDASLADAMAKVLRSAAAATPAK